MTKKSAIVILLVLVGLSLCAQAQNWSGVLNSSRAIDWSKAGVPGGIPNRTTTCATLNPGASASQINSAIANCPSGQVVKLNAGTYNLSSGITFAGKDNVTLRGAGPDQTFLVFSGDTSCNGIYSDICMGGSGMSYYVEAPIHVANWTGGYAQGSTTVTLANTTGLSVGMYMVLDQINDTSVQSGVTVCSADSVCSDPGEGGGGSGRNSGGLRQQEQFVKVTGISGTSVTFTPGLHMPNWRSSQSPQAWWGNASDVITGAGVEDLSLDHNASGEQSGIVMMFAFESWIKNVRSLRSNRNHVWLYEAAHNTIRDSYFYATQNAASQSYGVEEFMASDNLVENNIMHHVAVPFQTNTGSGSVFGYNYTFDDYYNVSPAWQQASSYLHGAGTDFVLHEGNVGTGFTGDIVHGTHNFVTGFRNYWNGQEPGKTAQTVPVLLYCYNRYMNFIGNVLGKVGYHDTYEVYPNSSGNSQTTIFRLGMTGNAQAPDIATRTTLMRWGNYDTVSNASRFVSSEVPTGLSQLANDIPASQNLPASFYMSAKPSWFGSTPFPAIGPDVSGGTGPGGHAYTIPAQACYNSSTKDSNGILTFNATRCYGTAAPAPAAPTGVSAVVR